MELRWVEAGIDWKKDFPDSQGDPGSRGGCGTHYSTSTNPGRSPALLRPSQILTTEHPALCTPALHRPGQPRWRLDPGPWCSQAPAPGSWEGRAGCVAGLCGLPSKLPRDRDGQRRAAQGQDPAQAGGRWLRRTPPWSCPPHLPCGWSHCTANVPSLVGPQLDLRSWGQSLTKVTQL